MMQSLELRRDRSLPLAPRLLRSHTLPLLVVHHAAHICVFAFRASRRFKRRTSVTPQREKNLQIVFARFDGGRGWVKACSLLEVPGLCYAGSSSRAACLHIVVSQEIGYRNSHTDQ